MAFKKNMPRHYEVLLPTIRKLSSKGLTKGQIVRQIDKGMNANSFSYYKPVYEAFENGRSDLALKVGKSFVENLSSSYSDRVHLSKSLRLFDSGFVIEPIVSVETALNALNVATQQYTLGNISETMVEQVRKIASTYADVTFSTELEVRLKKVEQEIADRKGV